MPETAMNVVTVPMSHGHDTPCGPDPEGSWGGVDSAGCGQERDHGSQYENQLLGGLRHGISSSDGASASALSRS